MAESVPDGDPSAITEREKFSNFIEEELANAHAQFAASLASNPFNFEGEIAKYLLMQFDIHAHHHRFLVSSYKHLPGYESYLSSLREHVTQEARRLITPYAARVDPEAFAMRTHAILTGRSSYWKAMAMKALRESEATGQTVGASGESTVRTRSQSSRSRRADWLRERLRERAWDKNDLARFGGPDRKTVQRVLDGFRVREDIVEKIATALSKKHAKVLLTDIPID